MCVLVDEPTDVLHTVVCVFGAHELVGVPYQVDVQRWDEERCGRALHQVQKPTKTNHQLNQFPPHKPTTTNKKHSGSKGRKTVHSRMISRPRMHQQHLLDPILKIHRVRPRERVHLVDEGALPDDSTDKLHRERPVVDICTEYTSRSSIEDRLISLHAHDCRNTYLRWLPWNAGYAVLLSFSIE